MQFGKYFIDLSQPQVMGILNVTPDSFSDGGKHTNVSQALDHALRMIEEGATFIDIGGESTRPGAPDVSLQEELDRTIPVIEAVAKNTSCVISIDTSKADVMREAVKAGAGLINDVRALQEPGALQVAAEAQVPVCLMHMQGQPRTMQQSPEYDDVVNDVGQFLLARTKVCEEAGIAKDKILFDPGYGFGKSLEHNYTLVKHLPSLMKLGYPVLVGMSRKSMIGNLLNRKVDERLAGSISLATIVAQMGAHIIRVHDVKETADAVNIVKMLNSVK
ncbi:MULTISPECIES: dihydropteroate synthase [Alteromonas]|uniref:Dihydropteroate synthase n=1 Tax=Alteromonas macleodii (strain English Channel 673) TaxID=1004788 RepID=A0AB32ZYE3_ALTME|nr:MULTISPECIES: dihydropteroate synthase [Alteromonas]MEC8965276.1 dihydropteroate synthase [Pseudomonadota bacterium]AFT74446.1 dihydropteroate synthase [Alteromonas macleodii str. 'English Channel 673']MBL3809320.1 dihydropteroate synthase [Alteromonas macleodii]MBL3882857.1 dihydropteroate synthase [Alteromonas macleodii]MDK2763446.1 dihydropteroate synthase [Alteromonas macleodii]|tara:strand:+ start:202 stop:1026 length:825 start_codon:yes stop_codon:yes gene_type:complete